MIQRRPGATAEQIEALELAIGPIPTDLRAQLLAANGVYDSDGQWEVGWPCDRIATDTRRLRAEGLLAPDEIAVGDDGTGDPFYVRESDGTVWTRSLITSESTALAPSLAAFWAAWQDGEVRT